MTLELLIKTYIIMNGFYIILLLIILIGIYGLFFVKKENFNSPSIEEFTKKIKTMADIQIEEYILKLEYIKSSHQHCLLQIDRDLNGRVKKQKIIDELKKRRKKIQGKCDDLEKKIFIAREEISSRNKKNR